MGSKKVQGFIVLLTFVLILAGCTANEEYELVRFKLDLKIVGNGTVVKDPDRYSFVKGSSLKLEAHPDEGWEFVRWEGTYNTTQNPIAVTVNSDIILTAYFKDRNANYTLDIRYSGVGTVATDPVQVAYRNGAQVTLTANPAPGYLFSHWEGDLTGNKNPDTITMDESKMIYAVFSKDAGVIQFGDADLEQAVRDAIQKVGPITVADVISLTTLDGSVRHLTNLQGIEYLTALTWLDLHQTGTIDLKLLGNLTGIDYLNLRDNSIISVNPLIKMGHLTELDLGYNQITSVADFVWFWYKNLRILRLNNNKIADVAGLAGLIYLEELDLSNNVIGNISALSELTMVRNLNLSRNAIKSVSALSKMTTLDVLDLSYNQLGARDTMKADLSELSWLWYTNIRKIHVDGNALKDINHLYGLSLLEEVTISNNLIDEINVLSNLTLLTKLDASNNKIFDINALRGLQRLTTLNLDNNQLESISALLDLPALEYVSIRNNPPLDLANNVEAQEVINTLKGRNVNVVW